MLLLYVIVQKLNESVLFNSNDIVSVSSSHPLAGKSSLLAFKTNAVNPVHRHTKVTFVIGGPYVCGGGHMIQGLESSFELRFHVGITLVQVMGKCFPV